MKNYSTLMFDALDTLIHVERDRLPPWKIGDVVRRTTAPAVYRTYEQEAGRVDLGRFFDAFLASSAEAERRRRIDWREIPSAGRFRIMLELLDVEPDSLPADLADRLAATHMEHLQPALVIRPESRQVLDWALARSYRLALVSNFDHSPTLDECLERHGVRDMFEVVVVSDAIGWRKPHPRIFEHTLEALGIEPPDALFIGDRLDLDVDGAVRAGIDAVWVDTGREAWSAGHSVPKHTIRSLSELVGILEETCSRGL